MKYSLCVIAQFPPPIHGLSKAVDTLCNSKMISEYNVHKIDITDNKMFLSNVVSIIRDKSELFYFTISQTKSGNIRDLIILKLIELKKKKVIIHLHGGYYRKMLDNDLGPRQKRLNHSALKKVAGAIVLGESLKYIFKGLMDPKKIHCVQNCVDDQATMSDAKFQKKVKYIGRKATLNILYLSNFIETKGYRNVLEIARILNSKQIYKFKFYFAGKFYTKDDEDFFFNFIKENDLTNLVEYKGIVSGKSKSELLKLSDIFILLTRYKQEGQPISIIEAMGNGMSIITTDYAGIPDLVSDNINGFLVPYNDYDKIITDLLTLYDNRKTHTQFITSNRKRVNEQFKEKHYLLNMNNVFNEVLSSEG